MYEEKSFESLLGLEGFSEVLLKNHFKLYAGYVKRTNAAVDKLKSLDKSSAEYAEVKRRFGWEFNGMRLHELYFGNMVKEGKAINPDFEKKLSDEFGSFDAWKEDFLATGSMPGIGWVVLAWDPVGNRLFNTWVNEHDLGFLAGCVPLLVMDVFEHAFMVDYGLAKGDYLKAFFNSIDWDVVASKVS